MKAQSTLIKVLAGSIPVIIPLIAAAWMIPLDFPMLLRQILLSVWGVGAILVAERLLFSPTLGQALRSLGFVRTRMPAVVVALLVSLPMWIFMPLYAWLNGVPVRLQPDWLALLLGVVLVNGITEEVIHRGFVFGHLRRERSFAGAATLSALLFAAQHLYLVFSIGSTAGLASVMLAALLSYPLAFLFEHGGNSIGGPAIIHTSTNAPVLILALPQSFIATALIPHMVVILISLYLVFAFRKFLVEQPQQAPGPPRTKPGTDMIYHIKIQEQLGEQWAEWFSPLVIQYEPDGCTTLSGSVHDQGELHGLLAKVRDLNLTLMAVNRIESTLKPDIR